MLELWRRILSTSGAKLYAAFVGVFTLSITARVLGPDGRGQVAAITTWVGMFATFGSLSLGQIAIHRATQGGEQGANWLPRAFSVLGSFTLVATLIGWLLALAINQGTSLFNQVEPALLVLGFALMPMMLWEQYGNALLMAREQLHISNRAQVLGRTLSAVLVAALVAYLGCGVAGALLATLFGQLVASGWMALALHAVARPLNAPSIPEVLSYLADGARLHLNAVGAFLISGMDVLMVNMYRGSTETGYYQLGVQLTTLMLIVPQAASMVIYGKVAKQGPDEAWPAHRRLLVQVTLFMAAAAVVVGWTASWWLPLLAGPGFEPTIGIFRWQLLGVVGMSFSIMMAAQWIGRGYFWQASLLTVAAGAANFVANQVLVPRYGMLGAVWASLGCYLLSIGSNGYLIAMCELRTRKAL